MRLSLALGLIVPFVVAKTSYDGWKAFSITTNNPDANITTILEGLDFVTLSCGYRRGRLEIAIPPSQLSDFEALGLNATVIDHDLGLELTEEGKFEQYQRTPKGLGLNAVLPDKSYFNSYHNLEQHFHFFTDLQASFPKNSDIFVAGKSAQKRDIRGIHLWGQGSRGQNPAIIWHGNVHAREWISGMTVEYLAYKIVQGYQKKDSLVRTTLDKYDFYILPIVNPDGFVYTTTNDRLWRKNRQKEAHKSCVGTDINRNWPYKWDIPGGSSTDPCNEIYRGRRPGDTLENKALVNHTMSISQKSGIRSYVDWHSYSQLILLPYGFDCSINATNVAEQMTLASGVSEAILAVNGLKFNYGPTCQTIYQTSGGSSDWVYDVAKADLAWGIELRPTGLIDNGFVLPPKQIVEAGEEIWAGMRYLFKNI
ncbi:carboxypeptidase [Fusarium heterosporum]|uniref:Carboxypeptidase n=1 Tax=Fusarium heterosporum TaxID=42747 RepID=A0A8H5T0Q0_FUSHE|nr:carboxypeptidase [Fusarium heterosporum]